MQKNEAARSSSHYNRAKRVQLGTTRILTQQDKAGIGLGLIFGLTFGLCLLHALMGVIQ